MSKYEGLKAFAIAMLSIEVLTIVVTILANYILHNFV